MTTLSAVISIVAVIIVYFLFVKTYSILFRMTGMSKQKSLFQTVSLLTSAGFTTSESELVVTDKTRRKIAIAAMVTGYFFSVLIVSLLVNLFSTFDYSRPNEELVIIAIAFASLLLFLIILEIPFIKKLIDGVIEKVTISIYQHSKKDNYISIVDNFKESTIAEVYIHHLPSYLEGKSVLESDIKNKYNVNILKYIRNNKSYQVDKDTIFSKHDILLVFGNKKDIANAFLTKHKEVVEVAKAINEISIIQSFSSGVLASIVLDEVPFSLRNKNIRDAKLKDYYSINVIMINRNGENVTIGRDTIIEKNDKVIVFGLYENIKTAFQQGLTKEENKYEDFSSK